MSKCLFSEDLTAPPRLRLFLSGQSGSGKSKTALEIATGLIDGVEGGKIAVIDTESGSIEKYKTHYRFASMRLSHNDQSPDAFMRAIKNAEEHGFTVVILDSLSHAWMGKGGILEMVDNSNAKHIQKWGNATPKQREFFAFINDCGVHVIATSRVKTQWVMEETINTQGQKKVNPVIVGSEPIQRKDSQYEFDIWASMDMKHTLTIMKSRCEEIDGKAFERPSKGLGILLRKWLDQIAAAGTITPGNLASEVDAISIPVLANEEQAKTMNGLQKQLFKNVDEKKNHFSRHVGGQYERASQVPMKILDLYNQRLALEIEINNLITTGGDPIREYFKSALAANFPEANGIDDLEVSGLKDVLETMQESIAIAAESPAGDGTVIPFESKGTPGEIEIPF